MDADEARARGLGAVRGCYVAGLIMALVYILGAVVFYWILKLLISKGAAMTEVALTMERCAAPFYINEILRFGLAT